MKFFKSALTTAAVIATMAMAPAHAEATPDPEPTVRVSFSDGRSDAVGLEGANEHLMKVGVRISQVPIRKSVRAIIDASETRSVTQGEQSELLSAFALDRQALLQEIDRAGRSPAVESGGFLSTSEEGVAPYPKVYDMKALSLEMVAFLMRKFGRLHVNRTDAGEGIDEVMTIISGGPYTWFFVLEDETVAKVRFGEVTEETRAWRISYPGLVPHGGYFDAEHGLVIAHAHGPEGFVMRYEDETAPASDRLGNNPWIDFDAAPPKLLDRSQEADR